MEWKCWFFQNSSIQNPLEVFLCRNSQVNPMLHLKVCVCVCQIWGQESSTRHGWVNLVIESWGLQNKKPMGYCVQQFPKHYEPRDREMREQEILWTWTLWDNCLQRTPLYYFFLFLPQKNFLQLFCYFESTVAFVCSFIRKPENKQTNSGAYLQWRIKSTGWAGTVFISLDGGSLI